MADREADIYEYMMSCKDLGHHFLVRMSQSRIALDPSDGQRVGTVFEHAAAAEPAGGLNLDLRARPGVAARRARLLISFGSVRVRAPCARRGCPCGRTSGLLVRAGLGAGFAAGGRAAGVGFVHGSIYQIA